MPTEISIGTSAASLLDLSEKPTPLKDAVLKAVLHGESIPKHLINVTTNSIHAKAQRYYEYGRDTYVNGLPTDVALTEEYNEIQDIQIINTIAALEGEPISPMEIIRNEPADAISEGQAYCHQYLGYNPIDKSIIGTRVNQDYFGRTVIARDFDLSINGILTISLYEMFQDGADDLFLEDLEIQLRHTTADSVVIKVKYYRTAEEHANPQKRYWWTYNPASGEFGELGNTTYQKAGLEYYPLAPIRINRENLVDKNTEESIQTATMLKLMGVDMQQISDGIAENPDIDIIDDAFIAMGFPVDTRNSLAKEYLYRYFDHAYSKQVFTREQYDEWFAQYDDMNTTKPASASPKTKFYIKDSYAEDAEYSQAIVFGYIDKEVFEGVQPVPTIVKDLVPKRTLDWIDEATGDRLREDEVIYPSKLILRYQISEGRVGQITVHGLHKTGSIYVSETRKDKFVFDLNDAFSTEVGTDGLFIPLTKNIIEDMEIPFDSTFYHESLHIVINAVQRTDLEWYETETFTTFLKFVGIVISLIYFSPQIAAIISATTLYAGAMLLLELVIETLIWKLVVTEVMEFIVEKVGGKFALVLAAVVAVAAAAIGVTGIDFGSLMPTAQELLTAVNAITTAISNVTADDFLNLLSEYEDFLETAEERQEELDAAQQLLNDAAGDLSALDVVQQSTIVFLNETPTEFLDRTVHTMNPGVLSLDAIGSYVDNVLKLPELKNN